MISKSVTVALDAHKLSHEKEEQIPAKEEGKAFRLVGSEGHALLDKLVLSSRKMYNRAHK